MRKCIVKMRKVCKVSLTLEKWIFTVLEMYSTLFKVCVVCTIIVCMDPPPPPCYISIKIMEQL